MEKRRLRLETQVSSAFRDRFGSPPQALVRAPGRVNLIGEHTDYNDGFVLPMAIDRAIWVALRPRSDSRLRVDALDYGSAVEFELAEIRHTGAGWGEYVKGVAWALQRHGYVLRGWEGVMAGDVPIGAGLSSSAALEMATAQAFATVSGLVWEPETMARLGQLAENEWVGVNCGIMDQMISAAGEADHALLIDCRSLDVEAVPLPSGTAVVVLDTSTRRGLVDSAYNERRAQCEEAARFFRVAALRDVSLEQLEAQCHGLDEVTRRRAHHVITENARTLRAAEAMRRGDAVEFGLVMDAGHASLRDDFDISSDELNTMVACARQEEGCYGARMTGGGFGGCAVALVDSGTATTFAVKVTAAYHAATGIAPHSYICEASEGAKVVFSH
jgi:galactokinase